MDTLKILDMQLEIVMNSTFKVVFNKARGALMVVNEATSSVQAKGTKTVIAAAVTALMAGGTMAGDLTYDSIVKNEGTFKFLNGKGETTHILTNASVPQLIVDLNNAKDKPEFADLFYAYGVLDSGRFIGESSHLVGLGSNQASFYLRA